MKYILSAPLRLRADGSIYANKNGFWKAFLEEIAIVLLLSAFFVGSMLLVLIDPFGICAPNSNDLPQEISLINPHSVSRNLRTNNQM